MSKKSDRERMEYLKGILFDENGDVLEYADPSDMAELSELMEKFKVTEKPKAKPEIEPATRTPVAQDLIDNGCEYMGTDGVSEYLYKKVKQPGYRCGEIEERQEAIIVTAGQARHAGMKFSGDLLAKLTK